MASAIDPTHPVDGTPASKSVQRANWSAAKTEIEALQTDLADFAGVDDTGVADGYVLGRASGVPAWRSPAQARSDLGVGTGGGDVTKVGTPANNQLGVWTGDGTVEGDANLTWDGGAATFVYRSTDAGPTTGPVVKLYRDSATPANDDILGEIRFDGEDSAGNTTTYAKIRSEAAAVTDGAETARLYFQMMLLGSGGVARDFVKFGPDTDVAITSPLDGTGAGPSIILHRNSPTPAASDSISQILFRGQDSGGDFDDYAQIKSSIVSPTATFEDGKLDFLIKVNGTLITKLSLTGTTTIYEAGGTDVALADGGTGSSTAGGARTNLGLVIGTDVLAFAGTGLPDEIDGHIETAANKTYVLGLKAAYGYTVNSLAAKTASGICTVKLTIDGVDVTGIAALSVTSTEASATASAANTVAVDTTLALVVSANSAALDLTFTVKITR